MSMKFEFDTHKNQKNRNKHGVDFLEAQTCFDDPRLLVREDPDAEGEARFLLIGLSDRLRLLTVVYTLPSEDTIRLISARLSTKKEAQFYA